MSTFSPRSSPCSSPRRILIITGDISGDIHCALLARELGQRHPDWEICAAGGRHLRGAGCRMIADTDGMGVIGLSSALALVPRAMIVRKQVLAWLQREKPDAVVLCDWGAFNVRLLPELKALGVRSLYYFPPRSWQKDGAGGLEFAALCDRIATPFEWSAQRLNAAGGRAVWVGHPLLEIVRAAPERAETRAKLEVSDEETLVALLPGSRELELKIIGPPMNGASQFLSKQFKQEHQPIHFVAAVPNGSRGRAEKYLRMVEVRAGEASAILKACDAALVKSGTATLEAAVADAPQVVCYDVPALARAQWVLTLRGKVRHVAMPNIILGRELVPELLGQQCNAWDLAREMSVLLADSKKQQAMRDGYSQVRRSLGSELPLGATARTADLLDELVDGQAA